MKPIFNQIRCDQLSGEERAVYDNLQTDICAIDRNKYVLTCCSIFMLIVACIYIWRKYEKCHKTLLAFHNLRAAVSLLLLAVNSLELARSLLPQRNVDLLNLLFDSTPMELNVMIVIGAGAVWNALAAILLTIMLMCYHRLLERKKATVFLYGSITVELLIFILRIYELAEVAYYEDFFELESSLATISVLSLLTLAIFDGYTIYKERYRDDYLDNYDRIGYKHSIATFYSKTCFWWLTPLLWLGYKEPLELEDLGHMRLEDSARAHYDRFLYIYTEKVKKSSAPPSLWYCYIKNSWRMFALGGILKLAGDLFALIGPLAIQQIVQYIEGLYAAAQEHEQETQTGMGNPNAATDVATDDVYYDSMSIGIGDVRIYYARWLDLLTNGWSIAWLVLLAALAQAALSQASTHVLNMTGIRIKTSLQGLIYRKSLLLNASSGCGNNAADVPSAHAVDNDGDDGNPAAVPTTPVTAPPAAPAPAAAADVQQNGDIKLTPNDKPAEVDATQQTERSGGLHDIGAITNHMTEDTLNIMQFFWISHYAWAIPFKIAIVIYLLYLKLGISAVIGAIVCIVIMTPLQFLIGNAMSKNADVIAQYTDERLKRIHDTLIGIKIIKLNAWDEVFLRKIQAARKKELKYLNKDAMYWTFMTILTHISTVLITLVTLAIYVCLPQDSRLSFNASHLFSALALFQQLTVPLLIFPITVPIIIAARVSTRRLERFLHAPEIQKQFEGIRNMARILSKSDASLDMYETQEKSNMTLRTAQAENKLNEQRLALRLRIPDQPPSPAPLAQSEPITPLLQGSGDAPEDKSPASFTHELGHSRLVQQRRELLRNTPYVAIRPPKLFGGTAEKPLEFSVIRARNTDSWRRDSLLLKMPDDIAVSINDGLFSWQPQRHMPLVQLHIQEMAIPKGKLTIIVGKNGSGKTSLLSALLMEMPLLGGNMFWHKNCTISYVPQCPWLLNDTIRENILFGESFRPKRYDFVLNACALKPDIELMPTGDFTIIGERGINLSGGQRQRIAIARAIYSSANVVIMDDPLSSLDNEVGNHVFEQCVRQMLLKSNRSIILVTQQLQLVKEADYLIVMKDGRLQACGSYKDIELKQPHIIAKWNSIIAKANANAKDQQQNNAERTARERWKLFKNVSKLGLQRSISVTSEAGNDSEVDATDGNTSFMEINNALSSAVEEDEDEDDDIPASLSLASVSSCGLQSAGSFNLHRKRSSVYGSRHLIYDVPLPIDECQADDVIMRPRRRAALQRRGSTAKSTNSWHRLSGLSTATATSTSSTNSGDLLRRSVLTASCSSYGESSVDGGDSVSGAITPPPQPPQLPTEKSPRAQSWQPTQKLHHPQVTRNVSSPPAMEATASVDEAQANTAATTTMGDTAAAAQTRGSFQQFLRRMSMRRSNKPKHHHRPLSATNSIRSISEESSAAAALLPTTGELSSVPSSPVVDISNPQATTNSDCETKMHKDAPHAPPTPPVKHVKIDFNALPTNGRNNNNNNDDNGDDMSDVTSLSLHPAQPEKHKVEAEGEGERKLEREAHDEVVQRSGGVASTMGAATTTDAERKYGQISHHIYLLYMRASGLPIIIGFFITALIWQCLRVYTDVWLQHWSDHAPPNVAQHQQHHQQQQQQSQFNPTTGMDMDNDEVTYYFRMYTTISCVCIIMAMISTPAGQWAGCNARRNLHDKLLQTILHKTLHFFQVTPLGRIVNRFSNDMAIIDKKIAATSQRLLQFSLLCLFAILINVSITPWFLALTLPICGAYYAIQKFYRCSARELQRIENSTNSPVISHLSETIQGVTTIRAYNQQARFTEILFKRLEANTIAFTILNTSNRWLGISLDYLGGCIVFVAIVTALATASVSCSNYAKEAMTSSSTTPGTYAINKSASSKELTPTPSLVGLAINYTLLVPIYLNWVVKLLADMEMYAGSVERIAHYAQQQPELELELEPESDPEPEQEPEPVSGTEMKAETEERHKQDVVEISNEVDRLSCCSTNPRAVDKVYPGATSAAVDVDGDTAVGSAAAAEGEGGGSCEDADKLNAGNGNGNVSCNHLNFHPASVVDKLQQARTSPTRMIKDKRMTPLDDKVALSNEPVRRIKTYQSVPISWPQRGDISFANVSLRYEGQRHNVISHLNLKIPAGQRIGICGRTGSGKSSLALSLFGVLQTTSGHICIDDVDIEQIRVDELRTRLSIIPQDVHLFNATIRENLDPHGYYSDLQLWNCLELAQLKEFVNVQLLLGLDTEITDGGVSLSAGHRQLLCLARAILRGSVCLVLDEATSTLDSSTERALLKAADKAFHGRTIITIAHRLSTILDYERIIVLEQGRIVEDGNPRQLQEQSGSIFYGLLNKGDQLNGCQSC
ncbi:ATP-binding cassette sub-family C member Sur isoform X1 [Drosophila albomicans]|uniref:ATP-binding cassette sub-family C member Sur isoform X1 n=1 Tax=Drosophila albomicans TaxID=7291 RepID=A0A9C6WFW9_DROAB|nr:ATP-binding cassette sub-family C member Sur isoform X1 [Drosophila albomicans]